MAVENIIVYRITSGDSTYPHFGNFGVTLQGSVAIDDSNGSRDWEFGDATHTGGGDVPDQDVTSSSVAGISAGDTIDSRYTYTYTGSDGSSGNVYFLATNSANNYGPLIASDTPLDPSVTYTFGAFNTDGAVPYGSLVQCFVRGTLIQTDAGEVRIEDLKAGDLIKTLDNGNQPIRWIGSRRVPAVGNFAPIRIRAGALKNTRDLLVSPQHRMLLTGWQLELMFADNQVLVPAKSLVNDHSILREEGVEVEYFHMMFDHHQIVFAEGAPSESFHPGRQAVDALADETRQEIYHLFPQLRHNPDGYGPSARITLKAHEVRLASSELRLH